jgi:hypothetical protein
MNKEFIPYEQALELKELGFDEPCMAFYELNNREAMVVGVSQRYNDPSLLTITDFCAPLYQQSFRWFREKYNLICGVQYMGKNKINWWDIYVVGHYNIHYEEMCMKHQSYEEAELECLKKLIEIVKNERK